MEKGNRWQLAVETALLMFLCSAGLACLQVFRQRTEIQAYAMMIGIPASAAGCFVVIASLAGPLLNTPRIRFPYNFTLPIVFCSLLPVCSLVVSTPEKGLVVPLDTAAYAHLWQKPIELVLVLFVEVAALSLYGLFSRS